MDRIVDYAEEGHRLETHDDIPNGIRDLIHTRVNEEEERRRRKQKDPEALPITLRVLCQGHRDDISDCWNETPSSLPHFPVPEDEAPKLYSDWLMAKVSNPEWRAASQLAGQVTVAKGYDLHWLYTHQKAGRDMLITNGVLEGVAARFVSWIYKWLGAVHKD